MSRSFQANGNITGQRFVKQDTSTASGNAVQAGANDPIIGIAFPGTRQFPLPGLDDGFLAIAGVNFGAFTETDECQVEIGAAVNNGDLLESNASGQAITSSTDGHNYGAVALQSGTVAGQLIWCRVRIGQRGS